MSQQSRARPCPWPGALARYPLAAAPAPTQRRCSLVPVSDGFRGTIPSSSLRTESGPNRVVCEDTLVSDNAAQPPAIRAQFVQLGARGIGAERVFHVFPAID